MSEEKRCLGHCCRAFSLGVPYEELVADPKRFKDGEQILDMLIPLGVLSDEQVKERYGISAISSTGSCATFTCKHLAENGDCSIYDNRPLMCVSYPGPTLKACLWKECEASCGLKAKLENVFGDANLECKHG
jgi:Fe-S-cluster containining protein